MWNERVTTVRIALHKKMLISYHLLPMTQLSTELYIIFRLDDWQA